MRVGFSKVFDKQFATLTDRQKKQARDAIEVFGEDPLHDSLRNHPLKEKWTDYRSISAADDLRLHYRVVSKDRALFVAVGTHDQLYK
jgi:addiction module RelE/StbE family toxin